MGYAEGTANLMSSVASMYQANAAAAQGSAQQQELDQQAKLAEINGEQQQIQRLNNLRLTMGSIDAHLASRNVDVNSPSAQAMQNAAEGYGQRDVQTIGFNAGQHAGQARFAGEMAQQEGKAKRMGYYLGGAGQFVTGSSQIVITAMSEGMGGGGGM